MNRGISVLGSIVVAALGVSSPITHAVCLEGNLSVERELKTSLGVVVVTVESERPTPSLYPDFADDTIYRIKVSEQLRGKVPKTMNLLSENSSGRFLMEVGETYLLFISKRSGTFAVDSCGNSGEAWKKRELLANLRTGKH
jgi:hypothetical protein